MPFGDLRQRRRRVRFERERKRGRGSFRMGGVGGSNHDVLCPDRMHRPHRRPARAACGRVVEQKRLSVQMLPATSGAHQFTDTSPSPGVASQLLASILSVLIL